MFRFLPPPALLLILISIFIPFFSLEKIHNFIAKMNKITSVHVRESTMIPTLSHIIYLIIKPKNAVTNGLKTPAKKNGQAPKQMSQSSMLKPICMNQYSSRPKHLELD